MLAFAIVGALLAALPLSVGHVSARPVSGRSVAGLAAIGTTAAGIVMSPTGTSTSRPGAIPIEEPLPPAHYVVLLVVDAARPSYLTLGRLPNIDALEHRGVTYDRAWVGQMESSTPGVHVTLGTGTLPSENGFLGFGWVGPQTRRYVDFRTLIVNGAVDAVLRSLPTPSVAACLHQFMPYAVSVAASGHKDYATVGLGGGAADYELFGSFVGGRFIPHSLHAPPPLPASKVRGLTVRAPLPMTGEDSWAFRYAADVAARVKPRLLMLNLPETDTWGNWYGPESTAVFRRLIENVDRGLGKIEAVYRRLGIYDKTDFILTADHAMMRSLPAHNWGLVSVAAREAGARVARADGAGGGVWLQDPTKARTVAQRLVALHPAHVEAVFYRSSTSQTFRYLQASPMTWLVDPAVATALQHLVDTTAGRNGPDLWVLYRENYTVLQMNVSGKWKGTHGGATWQVQHVPLIMAGPGIRQGVHSDFPARAIDIAPSMEYLLGLPSMRQDGIVLADALTNPLVSDVARQEGLVPGLDADVTALRAESRADSGLVHWPTRLPGIVRCPTTPKPAPHPSCTIGPGTESNQ